jgi:endonuclease YncB( thermonuclease family)
MAAHRALVVGQKVWLVDDVVTRDADGQRLAYVYLDRDIYNINNLVNAKLIGDGLARLGNFEGNARQRMYLENLGFIARQGKVGMWEGAGQ